MNNPTSTDFVLCAIELSDIVETMSEKDGDQPETRRRTIPIYGPEFDWWTQAVERRLNDRDMSKKELAEAIGAEPPEVTRCVLRQKPIYELLIAISDELGIPYPVILPQSEAEALKLATERRLFHSDMQALQVKAGVTERRGHGQPPPLQSEHAIRSRRQRRRS
jgi:transcriptional regulator with XRE-family HTH domain